MRSRTLLWYINISRYYWTVIWLCRQISKIFKHVSNNMLVVHVLVHHGDIGFGQILGIPF